jgi:uncharacterized protein (TIGR02611 family)
MGMLKRNTKKVLVGFAGWIVILAGAVMIPFPGPGWVVVFIGFAILATEFDWARDAQQFVKRHYDAWQKWFLQQPWYVKAIFTILTFLTASVIVWLVNGYGIGMSILHIDIPWLVSPFFR